MYTVVDSVVWWILIPHLNYWNLYQLLDHVHKDLVCTLRQPNLYIVLFVIFRGLSTFQNKHEHNSVDNQILV